MVAKHFTKAWFNVIELLCTSDHDQISNNVSHKNQQLIFSFIPGNSDWPLAYIIMFKVNIEKLLYIWIYVNVEVLPPAIHYGGEMLMRTIDMRVLTSKYGHL